jgi:hypothetical protein
LFGLILVSGRKCNDFLTQTTPEPIFITIYLNKSCLKTGKNTIQKSIID